MPRRLAEKFRSKHKLIFVCDDLEKASDRLSSKSFCFEAKGVPEYWVNRVISLYEGFVEGELSDYFCVNEDAHQESALFNPLLFVSVVNVLTEDVREGSSMEFFYAFDLALCWEFLK